MEAQNQPLCLCGGAPTGIRTNGDWSRKHGWSLPLHPLQGLAFLFLVMFALLHFGVLLPSLPPASPWKLVAAIVNVIIFSVHILVLLICMSLNPGDPNVRSTNGGAPASNTFDRSKRPHVILDQYCCICQVKVGLKSKHCSACNKCISDFDHHCKWLNNCIGGRNYRLFLSCVSTALLGCVVILLTSVVLIAAYFCHDSWLNHPLSLHVHENTSRPSFPDPFHNFSSGVHPPSHLHESTGRIFWVFLPVAGTLWLLVVVLTAVLSLLACVLLTHLLAFHIYLIKQGLSTYEYIVKKRDGNNSPNQTGNVQGNRGGSAGERLVKKGLLCPLQKWRRFKMANQILPVTNKDDSKEDQPDATLTSYSLQSMKQETPQVEEQELQSSTVETVSGGIYLGSPKRRNILPPIVPRAAKEQVKHQELNYRIESAPVKSEEKGSTQDFLKPNIACTSLPSLIEAEQTVLSPLSQSNLVGFTRHLSISMQSLDSIDDEDDPAEASGQLSERTDGHLISDGQLGGSLTNLLLLDHIQPDVNVEPHDIEDEEDTVHKVSIVQSPVHEPQEHLLFCPGKNRLNSLRSSGSMGNLSSHSTEQNDICVSDICSMDPHYADDQVCVSVTARRRPSVDVLIIPYGSDSLGKTSLDLRDRHKSEGTFIILHSERESKSQRFTPSRTNFETPQRLQQHLLV